MTTTAARPGMPSRRRASNGRVPVDFDAMRVEAPQIAAFSNAISRIAAQGRSVEVATAEPDETEPDERLEIDHFDGEFEIEAPAPQLAADDIHHEEPAEHDADAQDEPAREEHRRRHRHHHGDAGAAGDGRAAADAASP